jgi:hypothetical protein
MSLAESDARGRTHAYGALLLVIFASVCFQLAAPSEGWARLVAVVLSGGTLVLALRVSRRRPLVGVRAMMTAIVGTLVAVGVVALIDRDAAAPAHAIATGLTALALIAIGLGVVAEVREHGAVDVRTVAGVLCVYLLLGTLYAYGFQLIADLSSQPFFAGVSAPTPNEFFYFSYVTMTTTGYGDLTAATDVGRSVAIAEALTGQIYLVTIVALIITKVGRRPDPERPTTRSGTR